MTFSNLSEINLAINWLAEVTLNSYTCEDGHMEYNIRHTVSIKDTILYSNFINDLMKDIDNIDMTTDELKEIMGKLSFIEKLLHEHAVKLLSKYEDKGIDLWNIL